MTAQQHTLASLFSDIQNKDPRIDEFGQNAHEFTFLDFAVPSFIPDIGSAPLTLSSVAGWIEFFVECVEENVRSYCESIEEIREERAHCWVGGSKQDDENFFELLEVFSEKWNSADFSTKVEFVEAQYAAIEKCLAERNAD